MNNTTGKILQALTEDMVALDASIKSWQGKQEQFDRDKMYSVSDADCPLCDLANKRAGGEFKSCETCIIMDITGQEECEGTPAIIQDAFEPHPPLIEICFLKGVKVVLQGWIDNAAK